MARGGRGDTRGMGAAVKEAVAHVRAARATLEPFLAMLTDKERLNMPRAREGFGNLAPAVARAIVDHPDLAAAARFDPAAVVDAVRDAADLGLLAEELAALSRGVADTKLQRIAEAWTPTLAVYSLAKVKAERDGSARRLLRPFGRIFAPRPAASAHPGKRREKKPAKPAKRRRPDG